MYYHFRFRVDFIAYPEIWSKRFYFLLFHDWLQLVFTESSGQEIKFEAFDKDLDSDDFLGRWVLLRKVTKMHHILPFMQFKYDF